MPIETTSRENKSSVCVDSPRSKQKSGTDDVNLLELWIILWRSKWLIIGVTVLFIAIAIPYALSLTEWYRANALLAPAEQKSTSVLGGQLGGLASLAGVTVGGNSNVEPLAILQSRDFIAGFVEDHNLLPKLYADLWDAETKSWLIENAEEYPDMRDAVEFFQKSIISVNEDTTSGLVNLTIDWTDAQVAAEWVDLLVKRLNAHLRQRALVESESNVAYLQEELGRTNFITLQQSIGRLLESELQKTMLARGNEEFAFRIIDHAQVPKKRFRPNRALIVVVATFLGGMLSILFVFTRHAVRAARERIVS